MKLISWSEPIQIEEFMNQFENGARESQQPNVFSFGGLRAAAAARQPAKREDERAALVCELSDEMEWSEFICEWNEKKWTNQWTPMEWNQSTPHQGRQPPAASQQLNNSPSLLAGALRPSKEWMNW